MSTLVTTHYSPHPIHNRNAAALASAPATTILDQAADAWEVYSRTLPGTVRQHPFLQMTPPTVGQVYTRGLHALTACVLGSAAAAAIVVSSMAGVAVLVAGTGCIVNFSICVGIFGSGADSEPMFKKDIPVNALGMRIATFGMFGGAAVTLGLLVFNPAAVCAIFGLTVAWLVVALYHAQTPLRDYERAAADCLRIVTSGSGPLACATPQVDTPATAPHAFHLSDVSNP